eukprot:MONOS_16124.1-p1 / transcript=MONOS_16124.1 / gene=MONOS_16124 / organism=Monocercomonoides_exilis_PA203 / gene_product=unspecified product / transcript_product=unspecified product / location=Mono_scaffold01517:1-7258(-) / protein_length=2401 / sequence_SO=supercontig / SO=protein_coding / is_pseudo=false
MMQLHRLSGADFVHSWGGSMCFFNLSLALSGPNCLVHSLISFPEASTQQAHRNSIKLMGSSFSSFRLFDSQPLVQSSCCDVIKIELCSFENISQEHARSNVSSAQCSSFTLASCIICSIVNPTEGCIAPRISDGSLHFLNSSFLRCSKTAGQKINHTGSEDTLVDNCLYENVSDKVISHDSTGSCIVTNTDFMNGTACTCIFERNSSETQSLNNSFNSITTPIYASCLNLCRGTGPMAVQNNNMTSCEASWGGGCCHFHNGFSNDDIISDCSFKNCFVTETNSVCHGGGAIWNGEGAKVSYSNVAFENCCANETVGGAIYFDSREISLMHHSSLSYCLFVDCNALGDGKDIYAENPWNNILNEDSFVSCWTNASSESNRLVFAIYGDKTSWIRKPRHIFASMTGVNKFSCGWENSPCQTLSYSIDTAFASNKTFPIHIKIGAGVYTEKPLVIDSKYLVFEGSSNYGTKLSASSVNAKALVEVSSGYASMLGLLIIRNSSASTDLPLFSVSSASGELVLCLCKISAEPSQVSPFTTAFAAVSAGLLNVSSTTVESMIFSDVSAVRMESSTLHCFNFENASFRGITRSEGSGSVFDVTLGSGDELDLDEVSFSGCVCSKGDGGSVSCVLEGGGRLMLGATKRIEMEGCAVPQDSIRKGKGGGVHLKVAGSSSSFAICDVGFDVCTAWKGNNIFVDAISLSVSITRSTFGFVETGMSDDDLMGFEEEWRTDPVPLLAYLQVFSGAAVVGGAKRRDFSGCGTANYPCGSIGYAAGLRFGSRKRIITLNGDFEWTESVVFDAFGWEVKSPTRGQETKVSSGGTSTAEGMVTVEIGSLIANLSFSAAAELGRHSCFILCQCGELSMADCSLKCSSSGNVAFGFGFIKINGGSLQLSRFSTTSRIVFGSGSLISLSGAGMLNCDGCTMRGIKRASGNGGCISIEKNSLLGNSGCREITIDGCTFSDCCVGGNGGEGGGVSAWLGENDILVVNGSSCFEECLAPSEEGSSGKGGGMFLSLTDADAKFELSGNLIFDGNEAEFGKNVFISASDLNKTVTNDSFNFYYLSMINDKTLFVGSDNIHSDKDLFMFLVSYSSFEIFISSSGFDVARCGSEEEPCQTMWKGMENMKKEIGKKTIQIEGSTVIQDTFNVSNYQIKKASFMGEENTKATLNFEKAIGSQLEYFVVNEIHLELTNIQLQLTSGFDNSAKTIISNREGELVITGCSFHSEAGMNNGFDCVFVDAIGGCVEVNDLSMESCNVGNSIFIIRDAGITCHLMNVRVKSLNESGGCLLLIKGTESTTKINEGVEEINLQINNSSILGVKKSDNGASILDSKSEKKICLVVNESNITEDKAEESEKGGAIFFALGASGSMKVVDSAISQCSCTNGKGGGVYLATKERGDLNFTFVGMKFSANTAKVGNDIFIECYSITLQINESQFQFDLREGNFNRFNAIYGIDECENKEDTDLIDFVTIHQSDTIIVSSVNGSDERQCGINTLPCASIDYGLMHLTSDFMSLMFIVEESVIDEETNLEEMSLSSKSRGLCEVEVKSGIERTRDALITTCGIVSLVRVNFEFDSNFISTHESLISPEGGILEIMNCTFSSKLFEDGVNVEFANIPFHIINMEKGELQLYECSISNLVLQKSVLYLSSQLPSVIDSLTIFNSTISHSLIEIIECGRLELININTENITVEGNEKSLISCLSMKKKMQLTNCTIGGVGSKTTKGKLMKAENCTDVKMDSCIFDGSSNERNEQNINEEEVMCRWSGSLVDVVKSSVLMKDTTISNSPEGGITMRGGNVNVEAGNFSNNNPSIEGYPSLRRNIICSDSGILNVMSLKGGDGVLPNSSLWMLNEGCNFEGIISERDSSFFIPVLESVDAKEETDRMKLTFKGMLLIPCNLSFSVVKRKGEEKEIEKHDFDSNGFLSEREVEGSVGKDFISSCGDEIEVSVFILFGDDDSLSLTDSFVLKNASITPPKGDEKIFESGKEEKSSWALIIAVVFVILFLIVLIIAVAFIVRWKKQKRRTKELEVIVEDTVRKDPKLIEMVTMEMSPEEQWRRAEREAEKKNEERIKKRVYDTNMEHSESSEHLLSECGSTEYILGRDSDKIPQWMLEKVDEKEEEEEIRKRTPSPSISSTSTTDSDSTFIRPESMCPTTSSMSNLVDAMACSSPHEKLIVDLRDSLFMLLHGRNKTKEMAIGTVEERMATGAQILFWVGNVALHSFGEMEVPLESLDRLSPHIVLFSEHMVICVVMHSGSSSSEDSDTSSVSSLSVVSSSSNVSVMSERFTDSPPPSSAFEDEEGEKEYLRWRAPELLEGRKKHATKKSVVFSMGMMLWECVALAIPFGEYDAETAGEKVKHGERPGVWREEWAAGEVVESMVRQKAGERATLVDVKRELFKHFPSGTVFVT